jgi:hypothetical protein
MTDQNTEREPWDIQDVPPQTTQERIAAAKARKILSGTYVAPATREQIDAAKGQQAFDQKMRDGMKRERELEKQRADDLMRDKGRKIWEEDCAAITEPACFLHKPTGAILSDKAFAKKFGHLFGKKSGGPAATANLSKKIDRFDGLTFQPPANAGDPALRVAIDTGIGERGFNTVTRRLYNTYRANPLLPLRDRKPDVFMNHLRYLVPDVNERRMLVDWLAWIVQHPGQKPQFAILLIGGEGTGKSWLADLMKVIVGPWNVSTPRNKTLVRDFNGWLAEKTLAIVHELKGKVETSENLKDIITQSTVEVNRKGIEAHEIPNHVALFTISNHDDAIPLDDGSRRYLVIQCAAIPNMALAQPSPDGLLPYTRTPEMLAYYAKLFDSQLPDKPPTDETRRVLAFLLDRDLKRPGALDCLSIAPETAAKAKVVEAGRSSLDSLVARAYRAKEPPFARVFSPSDVIRILVDAAGLKIESREQTPQAVAKACRTMGCAPILDYAVSTKNGRKHLWARTAQDAGHLRTEDNRTLARHYHEGLKVADADERARIERETSGDFADE